MSYYPTRAAFVALLIVPLAAVALWASPAEESGSAANIDTVPVYGGNLNMAQRQGARPSIRSTAPATVLPTARSTTLPTWSTI